MRFFFKKNFLCRYNLSSATALHLSPEFAAQVWFDCLVVVAGNVDVT